jgi:hypothetical protein
MMGEMEKKQIACGERVVEVKPFDEGERWDVELRRLMLAQPLNAIQSQGFSVLPRKVQEVVE